MKSLLVKLAAIILLLSIPVQAQAACVILLHGLARTNHSMKKLEKALQQEHYTTVNVDYPSRIYPIEILAKKPSRKLWSNARKTAMSTLSPTRWAAFSSVNT